MRALDRSVSFVVARNGTSVGELMPFRRPRFVAAEAAVAAFAGAPTVDFRRFRSDVNTPRRVPGADGACCKVVTVLER